MLAGLLVAACQSVPAPAVPVTGTFGGQHVSLTLGPTGGSLAYDCAAGSIDEPVIPDRDGRFRVRGTHIPGHGGPERVGELNPAFPATYEGRADGGRLSLIVRVVSTGEVVGQFTLRLDAEPMLTRCL
jgi:hypothetical protein